MIYLLMIIINFFPLCCHGIEQAITFKNTSPNAIIVGLTNPWCSALEQKNAQDLLAMYLQQTTTTYQKKKSLPLFSNQDYEKLCFCALLSPGNAITYHPQKYAIVLATRLLDAFVWDIENDILASQRNISWGAIIIYPQTMLLEKSLGNP